AQPSPYCRCRTPTTSLCAIIGTQSTATASGDAKWAHRIPSETGSLQCGRQRRTAQHACGAKADSEMCESPQNAVASTTFGAALNSNSIPEAASAKSFRQSRETTELASRVLEQHCSRPPISFSSDI